VSTADLVSVEALAFGPDGSRLFVLGQDARQRRVVRCVLVADGSVVATAQLPDALGPLGLAHGDDADLLVVRADGALVVAAGALLDARDLSVLGQPLAGASQVLVGGGGTGGEYLAGVRFLADGNLGLVVGTRAVRYSTDVAELANRACDVAGRRLTQEEWRRFVGNRPYEPACGP
jgi:hypothetical protein